MEVGFTTVTFRDKKIAEIFRIASENGIKLLEWGGDVHLKFDDSDALAEIITLSKQYGITAFSYGSYYRVGEGDFIKFEKICKIASSIYAKVIRIWLGTSGSFFTSRKCFFEMVGETIKLCDIAKKYNLIVASEFHQKTYNDRGCSAIKFINAVNRDNYKTYWQPLGKERKDTIAISMLLPYLAAVHVFNWKNFDERYEFSVNCDRWKNFFAILKQAPNSKNIPLIMEFVKDNSESIFEKDAATIKKMVE